jgi:hypothetical protein
VELLNSIRADRQKTYVDVMQIGNFPNPSFSLPQKADGFQVLRYIEVVDSFGLSNQTLKILGIIGNFLSSALTLPWILEKILTKKQGKKK